MSALRLRYETIEFGKTDIHIRALRDTQQYDDESGAAEAVGIYDGNWAIFGILWPSSRILAQLMQDQDIVSKRILEVGCGIGLASLLLNERKADITASDYNPAAGEFLAENVQLNSGRAIPFVCANWADENSELGKFDLIIGSDLLYDRWQVGQLSTFIDRHANEGCEVILLDPGRKHHANFSKTMVELGYSHEQESFSAEDLDQPEIIQILRYAKIQPS